MYVFTMHVVLGLVGLFYAFFFNDTATTEIYTLSLHDALPILVNPSPTGTFTLQDAPSFAWRSNRDRGMPHSIPHRVIGGSCLPPIPTERSVRISRTTLFRQGFTAQRMTGTQHDSISALDAVTENAP